MGQDSIRLLKSKANVVEGRDIMMSWAGKEASGRSSSDRKGMSFSIFQPVESMRYQNILQSSATDMQRGHVLCLHNMTTSALRILKGTCVLSSLWNSGGQLVKSQAQEHEEGVGKAVKMVIQTGLKFTTYIWKKKGTKERSRKERRKTRVIRTSLWPPCVSKEGHERLHCLLEIADIQLVPWTILALRKSMLF